MSGCVVCSACVVVDGGGHGGGGDGCGGDGCGFGGKVVCGCDE